eukprot:403336944
MLQTAYTSTANIVSLMLDKNGFGPLGYLSIGTIYISWGLGSFLSPTIYKRWGSRFSIFIGTFSNSTWIYSSIITLNKRHQDSSQHLWYQTDAFVYTVVLMNSVFNGFCNGPMWVAICKQIASYSSKETYGLYFSYFWVFYISSQIFGNSIAAYVLSNFSQLAFFAIMGTLALVAAFYFCFLTYEDDERRQRQQQVGSSNLEARENLLIENNQPEQSVLEDVKDVFKMIGHPKMRYLIPQIFYTGVSIAFYTGLFVTFIFKTLPSYYSESEQFSKSMSVMSLIGLGALFGTILIGYTYDKFGHKPASIQNIVILLVVALFVFAFGETREYNYQVFMMTLTWGMMDSSMATHCYSSLGIEFNDNPVGYALYNLFQSLAVLIFQMIHINIKGWDIFQTYSIFILILGYIFFTISYFMPNSKGPQLQKTFEDEVTHGGALHVIEGHSLVHQHQINVNDDQYIKQQ